jgi:hypothetical protein
MPKRSTDLESLNFAQSENGGTSYIGARVARLQAARATFLLPEPVS